jgi:hypothetical protein
MIVHQRACPSPQPPPSRVGRLATAYSKGYDSASRRRRPAVLNLVLGGTVILYVKTNDDGPSDESPVVGHSKLQPAGRRRSLAGGLLVGLAISLVITVVVTLLRERGTAPRLSEADYEAALERWDENGPQDYDLDVELLGNRSGKIHVEVRGGEVVHMTRDGVEPSQKRTWDVWSVPGQLDTIGQEIEMARDPAKSYSLRRGTEVVMWAEFDPFYGYPRRFDRVVMGADLEVHWQTRFTPLEPKK